MRTLNFTVTKEYDGRPVLHYLKGSAGLSSHLIRNLKCQENGLQLNGLHTRTVDIIHTGDIITINIPSDGEKGEKGEKSNFEKLPKLDILFEDEDLIVINKPAMLAIHPSHNHQGDTLANALDEHLKFEGKVSTFRAVGRLDKGTSGIVVCALNSFSASKLQAKIHKTYYAIPSGGYEGHGTIDAPIFRPDPIKTYRCVDPLGDKAITHWESLKTSSEMALLKVNLETGRTHQIRVHFAYLGTPLIGDTMYGEPNPSICHQALHCGEATFTHPYTGEEILVFAPIPEDMQQLIDKI